MEDLLPYVILYLSGSDSKSGFEDELNRLFLKNPNDEHLLALQSMTLEPQRCYAYIMNNINNDKIDYEKIGKVISNELVSELLFDDMKDFAAHTDRIWKLLLERLDASKLLTQPYSVMGVAQDMMDLGQEKKLTEMFKEMMNHYDLLKL